MSWQPPPSEARLEIPLDCPKSPGRKISACMNWHRRFAFSATDPNASRVAAPPRIRISVKAGERLCLSPERISITEQLSIVIDSLAEEEQLRKRLAPSRQQGWPAGIRRRVCCTSDALAASLMHHNVEEADDNDRRRTGGCDPGGTEAIGPGTRQL